MLRVIVLMFCVFMAGCGPLAAAVVVEMEPGPVATFMLEDCPDPGALAMASNFYPFGTWVEIRSEFGGVAIVQVLWTGPAARWRMEHRLFDLTPRAWAVLIGLPFEKAMVVGKVRIVSMRVVRVRDAEHYRRLKEGRVFSRKGAKAQGERGAK